MVLWGHNRRPSTARLSQGGGMVSALSLIKCDPEVAMPLLPRSAV